jgi:glycosyltransferase involved in cell wall biosynthesis
MRIGVGIATAGRRRLVAETLMFLNNQLTPPDRVFVCPASPEDFDRSSCEVLSFPLELVSSSRGLCAQRNAILRAATDMDVLLFLDDDFYPAPNYIEELRALMQRCPNYAIVTGTVVADGAQGPGISVDLVPSILSEDARQVVVPRCDPTYGGYGCNMALRLDLVRAHALSFDERLPLYGWLEDIDLSRRMARYGEVVRSTALRGVHLGAKGGRGSGLRLGYSQIANPVYMVRKGSMTARYAAKHIARNVAANIAKSVAPEPWIDRRGRLRGNLLAMWDEVRGRTDPERVLSLG